MRSSKTQGLGRQGLLKNNSENPVFLLQRPPFLFFFESKGTECCTSSRTFLLWTIFYKLFREKLSLPFPVVWPGTSSRQRGTAKPKCRCSSWQALHGVSWLDKGSGRNTAIYLYPLWFCVLRPRLPDPGWILSEDEDRRIAFRWHTKWTVSINVRSICVNRVWGFDVWSNAPPFFSLTF